MAWFRNCCRTSSRSVSAFWQAFFRQVCQYHNLCLQRSFLRENQFLRKFLFIVFGPWAKFPHTFSEKFRRRCKHCNLRVESKFLREIFSSNYRLVSWSSLHFESKVFGLSVIKLPHDCASCSLRVQGNFSRIFFGKSIIV